MHLRSKSQQILGKEFERKWSVLSRTSISRKYFLSYRKIWKDEGAVFERIQEITVYGAVVGWRIE